MSQKWRRSQAWDDAFFPPWAFPAKFVLRAFSSIWLAVILLSFVAMYGALASVPVGMIVAGLTYFLYALTLLAAVALLVVPGVLVARRVARAATWFADRGCAGPASGSSRGTTSPGPCSPTPTPSPTTCAA